MSGKTIGAIVRGRDFEARRPEDVYLSVLQRFARAGGIPVRSIEPVVRDPIAQLVVEALMARGPSNISQVAEYLREAKGTSSRATVRDRLSRLRDDGIVAKADSSGRWLLNESFLRKCLEYFIGTQLFHWYTPSEFEGSSHLGPLPKGRFELYKR